MQVSTKLFNQQQLKQFSSTTEDLQDLQNKIGSGQNILRASDDPLGSVELSGLNVVKSQIEQFERNVNSASDRLNLLDKNLENLSIPYNELTELPNSFENLESLRKLNLCSNNFTKFPKVLFKLKKLDYLHIDGNNISEEEILKFSNELPECFVTYDPNQGSKKKRIILNNKKIV